MTNILESDIYSLAFGGRGVGKVHGKVCFVEGGLPGETVTFHKIRETSSYIEGRVTSIKEPSPDRTEPVCPLFGRCGGCQLQHIKYEKEVLYKQQQVRELLSRIGREDPDLCGEILPSNDPYGYRSSVTVHKSDDGFGLYDVDGRSIVPVGHCPVATAGINSELSVLGSSGSPKDVTIKSDHTGKAWVMGRPGERFFIDSYLGQEMVMSTKAFSQVNRYVAGELAATLKEWMGPADEDSVLFDAYCGVGFFSFLSGGGFSERIGMDDSRIAIDCAKQTVKSYGLKGYRFYRGNVESDFGALMKANKRSRNILLIDPPRRGAKKAFLEEISSSRDISAIYYISCDPARMARDIKIIRKEGSWAVSRVKPFDMFPRTGHVEVLAEFIRKDTGE